MVGYCLRNISLLLSNHSQHGVVGWPLCTNSASQHAVWITQFCLDAETVTAKSPLPGFCPYSVTIVATSLILLLAPMMLVLLMSGKSFSSRRADMATQRWWAGLCMARLQSTVAKSRQTLIKQRSARNKFKRRYRCVNLRQTDHVANMVPEYPPICSQPITLSNKTFLQTL